MLENQSKKIILLSNDPADASFLSEIAVTQQADLILASDAGELCSKIAESRADQSLAAIFVDVSTPALLRKFEHEFQSKLGNTLTAELSPIVHFISGTPLALNREIRQSPYFSFYSERKSFDFHHSAEYYQNSFYRISEFSPKHSFGFDKNSRAQCFEKFKKEILSKGGSAEWLLKFKNIFEEMIEEIFPVRFDFSLEYSGGSFRLIFSSGSSFSRESFDAGSFLNFGVSAMLGPTKLVLFVPIFANAAEAVSAFRFYKVEL